MMVRLFVEGRRDVTTEELIEYNAFCQMLPGPSSTQTIVLIAFKRGGIPLAIATLLIWMLPAVILMTAASFLVRFLDKGALPAGLLTLLQPMSVGFVFFAALRMMKSSVRHPATWGVMLVAAFVTLTIRSPWVFPALMIGAGIFSNFSSRRIPETGVSRRPIRWMNLWLFALLFIGAGVASESVRNLPGAGPRLVSLFENFYRFGAIVFGGGQVLLPMMLYQFVSLPAERGMAPLLSAGDLLTGYGLVQAVPGPVFSLSAYTGGLLLSNQGPAFQLLGALIAAVGVFLPSTLLLLFLFPLYQNIKSNPIVYRALEGIHAAIVGIIWASGIVLFESIQPFSMLDVGVTAATFLLLQFTKIPAPALVAACLLAGGLLR